MTSIALVSVINRYHIDGLRLYIYIYIYIYIVIHKQTVSFYQNSSVWLDTQDARSRERNPSNFTLNCDSDHSSTKRTTLTKGIF